MAKGFKGPGMGRPKFEWTESRKSLFESLMGIPFVTEVAICEVLGCGKSTLQDYVKATHGVTFQQLKAQKHEGVKLKLSGKQYEMAMKGSVPMAIWLGKQWLGQSDKMDQKIDLQNISDEQLDKKIKELEGKDD